MSIVRVTEENHQRLAELISEETSVPILVAKMFFEMVIGLQFTDEELTERINTFIRRLTEELERRWTEVSIDEDGMIFYYNQDDPDDIFYPDAR